MKRAEPWSWLEIGAFIAFLLWSAAGLFFLLERITPQTIGNWSLPRPVLLFVVLCLRYGDPALILLAFANTHLHAARQWTAQAARRWVFLIVLFSFGVEVLGVHTGLPFGQYVYTDRFGPGAFGVPLAIPLAWYVVLTNVLFVVRMANHFSPIIEAIIGGVLCMLYDFILEPFAKLKDYWIWTGNEVSPLNYPAWFFVSGVLIWLFAPPLMTRDRLDPRPWIVLGMMILIFKAATLP